MILHVLQSVVRFAVVALLSLNREVVSVSPPNQESGVTMVVGIAGKDGPVQVIGLKRPQRPSRYPLVHVRNSGTETTKQIWMEAIISGGANKTVHIDSDVFRSRSSAERGIGPHNDGWVQEPKLQSSALVLFAKQLHSDCLKVAVLVTRVEFTNGSSWNRDQSQKPDWLILPEEAGIGDPCKQSAVSDSDLELLTSAEYVEAPDGEVPDSTEVRTYLFSCPLVHRSGGFVAMCPF